MPTLLSTPLGKRLLFNLIEKRYHLSLEADNLSLSWWGPQKIEHLKISPLCLEWEVIQTDLTLFQLIRSDAKKFYGKNGQIVLPTSGKSLQGIDASLQSSPEKTWDLHLTNVDLTIDASVNINTRSGPFQIHLNSPDYRLCCSGKFEKGVVLFDQPLHAQITWVPEISQLLFPQTHPLACAYSKDPITLEIPPEGVEIPLFPYQPSQITIPHATLELGQIFCRNAPPIQTLLHLLKSKGEQESPLSIWFAPIEIHCQKGVLEVERTEVLLANRFEIAFWGTEDHAQLGFPTKTLQKAFKIIHLPEEYVLTIPLKKHFKIDQKKAISQIASLIATQKPLLSQLFSQESRETMPPIEKTPPAKHPFPWEEKKKNPKTPHEKKHHFKHNEKPWKQLFKVIR